MSRVIKAALLTDRSQRLSVQRICLPDPGPGEVRVRMAAAGVCHSDLSVARGIVRADQPVPAVLGHEGSGVVAEVGPGVTAVEPGDHVVFNWNPACGTCTLCVRDQPFLCTASGTRGFKPFAVTAADGREVFPGTGPATFGEESVVPASWLVPIPRDIPLELAALLGCAVLTGVGAVLNAARVRPGDSVVVIGLGGVGLSALQGARIAGAGLTVAVDLSPDKESLATQFGADQFVSGGPDVVRMVRRLTRGGADHVVEAVGRATSMRQAIDMTRRGGTTTVVGMGSAEDTFEMNALEIMYGARTLIGSMYGSSDPVRDLPLMVEHLRNGKLDLHGLVTGTVGLDGIEAAFDDLDRGRGGRTLVTFD